ncbi:hypothetical protein [Salinivibrio sp. HTSP]|uniref:hypothetical protein n=1 Tax=Salinivibrio sp. HTSP TaxID=2115977 RepID=UPI000E324405|nr:hypothetical protein [Salinivibrio sp. HTSP]
MKEELYQILRDIYDNSGKNFAGLGIVVSKEIEALPISPIYNAKFNASESDLSESLRRLSVIENPLHDGFHVLSNRLELIHNSQYFFPTPIKDVKLNPELGYGTRYLVAKIGSALPQVLFSAVVGNSYGIQFFENGREIEIMKHD